MKPKRLGLLQMEEDVGLITWPILFEGRRYSGVWESDPGLPFPVWPTCRIFPVHSKALATVLPQLCLSAPPPGV